MLATTVLCVASVASKEASIAVAAPIIMIGLGMHGGRYGRQLALWVVAGLSGFLLARHFVVDTTEVVSLGSTPSHMRRVTIVAIENIFLPGPARLVPLIGALVAVSILVAFTARQRAAGSVDGYLTLAIGASGFWHFSVSSH